MQREIVIQILTSVGYEQNALYANWFEIVCRPDKIAFKNELRFLDMNIIVVHAGSLLSSFRFTSDNCSRRTHS